MIKLFRFCNIFGGFYISLSANPSDTEKKKFLSLHFVAFAQYVKFHGEKVIMFVKNSPLMQNEADI